jgi:hypothetical protein
VLWKIGNEMTKQANYVKADILKNFGNGKMPKVKIDWRGLLYINRADKWVKVKCVYSNSDIDKDCTHDCVAFHEPIIYYERTTATNMVRIILCNGNCITCQKNEFLDERLLSIGERRYMNECGDFYHLDTRDDV